MQDLLPLITGGAGALVVLALWVYAFFSGKLHSDAEFTKLEEENSRLRAAFDKLQETLSIERQATNDTARAGAVTNKLIEAIVNMAAAPPKSVAAPDLTAKDLGL